jgi:hypothetical protein
MRATVLPTLPYLYDIGTIGQIGFFPRDFERYGGVKVTYRYR